MRNDYDVCNVPAERPQTDSDLSDHREQLFLRPLPHAGYIYRLGAQRDFRDARGDLLQSGQEVFRQSGLALAVYRRQRGSRSADLGRPDLHSPDAGHDYRLGLGLGEKAKVHPHFVLYSVADVDDLQHCEQLHSGHHNRSVRDDFDRHLDRAVRYTKERRKTTCREIRINIKGLLQVQLLCLQQPFLT